MKKTTEWTGSYATGNPIWGVAESDKSQVRLSRIADTKPGIMPNVTGMGARDAVFLLESKGLKVSIKGRGKVKKQSLAHGKTYKKGDRVLLEML